MRRTRPHPSKVGEPNWLKGQLMKNQATPALPKSASALWSWSLFISLQLSRGVWHQMPDGFDLIEHLWQEK